MTFRDWQLYHQIHPIKLATDIGVTPPALYLFWEHSLALALLVAFVPPLLVSVAMWLWLPDVEALKQSTLGSYLGRYMTPLVQALRLLTVLPMALGAWWHDVRLITFGLVALAVIWCNGIVARVFEERRSSAAPRGDIRRGN